MKTSKYLSICAVLAAGAFLSSCAEEYDKVDNKLYVNGATNVTTLLLDGEVDATAYTLKAQIPNPAGQEIQMTYAVDASLVDAYNAMYGMNTVMLPEEFYSIPDPVASIEVGGMESSPVSIEMHNLGDIDPDYMYCLPVTVASSNIPVLASQRTKYFVVRGASLINWVTNMYENYLSLAAASQATGLGGMSQITVEALIRPAADFGEGNGAGISSLIGIEGNGLLRFGDSGVDPTQLQFANSFNVTNSQWRIEKEKWQFVTFTYDSSNGQCQFFIDGVQKGETMSSSNSSRINWNSTQFFIGKSYDNNRDFHGDMAEVRVWNRILTAEELRAKNHFYKVDPDSEGLVAYWKMNEGEGNKISDYANGYDLNANTALTWVPVTLPQ